MNAEPDSTDELKAEIAQLRQQCEALSSAKAELEAALAARSDLLSTFFEQLPVGGGIFRADGLMAHLNLKAESFANTPRERVIGHFNLLADPQTIARGMPAAFAEVLKGATITNPPYQYDSRQLATIGPSGRAVWLQTVYFPLTQPGGAIDHVGAISIEVTELVEQQRALEATRSEVAAAQGEVEAQRETIAALSSPVVQVWKGILTIPLIGVIDERRASKITEDLLAAIAQHRAECVILDVTGVALMDTQVASYLLATTRACRLLGCEAALVGIGPDTAQSIVQLGVDLSGIVTRANLQAGIAWAFERRGLSVV